MKEVYFRDRVPLYPGRFLLVPVEGQTNTWELVRADEPTEEGTPIDKATFNSIIHSRLTGRYYAPTVARAIHSTRTATTNLFPTSGWTYDADSTNRATNGIYTVETSSNNGSDWLAGEAFRTTGWQSSGGDVAWVMVHHPAAIKVKNVKFRITFQYEARFSKLEIQGSNNGESWTTVGELTTINTGTTVEYELGAPGEYTYFRLYFTMTDSNRVTVSNLAYSLYDVNTYTNAYTVAEGLPASWTKEQRVLIVTPAELNNYALSTNTLNGVAINTILQAGKRYDLRYNGAAFDAKEV